MARGQDVSGLGVEGLGGGGAAERGLAGGQDVSALEGEQPHLLSDGRRLARLQPHQLQQPLPLLPLRLPLPPTHIHTLGGGGGGG